MNYSDSFGYVYKWTDSSNGKLYIGSKKGFPEDTNYIGSGVLFLRAYKKRPESFSREILYSGFDFREYEDYILNEVDAAGSNKYYNLKNASIGGKMPEEHYEKISKERIGVKRPKWIGKRITKAKWEYKVYCGITDLTYENTREASKELSISESHIRSMLNNNRKNSYKLKKINK